MIAVDPIVIVGVAVLFLVVGFVLGENQGFSRGYDVGWRQSTIAGLRGKSR